MWEFVEKAVYINLDRRTDRNERTKEVLSVLGDKVIRMSAIEENPGFIGCLKSHITVLEMAKENKWKNVLICEDDVEWFQFDEGYKKLEELSKKNYDSIHLGPFPSRIFPGNHRLGDAQLNTAYLVNSHYYDTLLDCFRNALPQLIETHDEFRYGADQCWKPLIRRDTWYAPFPPLVYQRPGFSDIRNTFQDHHEKTVNQCNNQCGSL
jgi:glycosyl transferase family 25